MKIVTYQFITLLLLLYSGIAKSNEINAVTEVFYPYQIMGADNKLSGYSIDVVDELFKITGDKLNLSVLPWSVAYKKASTTPDLMIFSIGKNQGREQLFDWTAKIATEKLYFWILAESQITPSTKLSDFKDMRIAVVKDATTHEYLSKLHFSNLYIMGATTSNSDEVHRIKMLLNGRADIVIAVERGVFTALKDLGLNKNRLKKVFRASMLDSDLHIAFNNESNPALTEKYRSAMEILAQTGKLTTLKKKWRISE